MSAEGWGSIVEVVNEPLEDVAADASWCSVFGMCVTCPISGICAIFGGLCKCMFVIYSIGVSCLPPWTCCSGLGSVQCGRPLWLAPSWWRYTFTGLVALIAQSRSRLALFIWEWQAFGSNAYWWHGEGFWTHTYKECSEITKSNQRRASAFGCIRACIPDLFATNILIFLSNDGPESQWGAIRTALHNYFLDTGKQTYNDRVGKLPSLVKDDWPLPKLSDMDDVNKVQKTVCKCVFYVMFGIWITEEEAQTLTGWRTNAMFFILPRLAQRFALNYGINKVKQLRIDTVDIVQTYKLEPIFVQMNEGLGKWKRDPTVKLCDEIMYVIGFAGMGGTSACVETVGSFLQVKVPAEASANLISFEKYPTSADMINAYKASPINYIKEACRIDPPVTSATQVTKIEKDIELNGKLYNMPEGTLNQYVISMANRDETVFKDPSVFDPTRSNLSDALTWNGGFGTKDDDKVYPRICPGRYLSLDVATTIVNHVLQL